MTAVQGFGVDIGGSGIKGCLVDLEAGALIGERVRVDTPQPSTPAAVYDVVAGIVSTFGWTGRIGCTYPGVMKKGVAHTAANMDKGWIGTDVDAGLTALVPGTVETLNDADAAGIAEMRYGAGRDRKGVVLMLTFGTGIGSALFRDGRLVPNTELGHLELDGHEAERRASDAARKRGDLSWEQWAERLNAYLAHVDLLVRPDLVVLGGGVSKKADHWLHLLDVRPPVRPAQLLNDAGIVGAALLAAEL